MSITQSDIEFVQELFAPLGSVTYRKMMGGLTIYLEGQVFAILDRERTVFLKAKGEFATILADSGSRQFGEGGNTMGYWTLPEIAVDDPEIASD